MAVIYADFGKRNAHRRRLEAGFAAADRLEGAQMLLAWLIAALLGWAVFLAPVAALGWLFGWWS